MNCTGSVCFDPPVPSHGILVFARDVNGTIQAGAIAEYECEQNFQLAGPDKKICMEDGKWLPEDNIFCALTS